MEFQCHMQKMEQTLGRHKACFWKELLVKWTGWSFIWLMRRSFSIPRLADVFVSFLCMAYVRSIVLWFLSRLHPLCLKIFCEFTTYRAFRITISSVQLVHMLLVELLLISNWYWKLFKVLVSCCEEVIGSQASLFIIIDSETLLWNLFIYSILMHKFMCIHRHMYFCQGHIL